MWSRKKLTQKSEHLAKRADQINQALELVLYVFSAYALPVAIGLLSLVSLFFWQTQYSLGDSSRMEIRVVKVSEAKTPQQMLPLLKSAVAVKHHDTDLSEAPHWISFTVSPAAGKVVAEPLSVEFPSRHSSKLACWGGPNLRSLGSGNPSQTTGSIKEIKSGFALSLPPDLAGNEIVCCVESVGPARISAALWQTADLELSAQEFHRKSGLLDGGILILAVFVLITALINRSGLYMIFAAWLIVNLRMGALSAGWDSQWLGNSIPNDWLLRLRLVTTAIYYLLSITLFSTLFAEDLHKVRAVVLDFGISAARGENTGSSM